MDLKLKVRTVARRHFTKSANVYENLIQTLATDPSRHNEVVACRKVVQDAYSEVSILDKAIQELIINSASWEEKDLEKELDDAGKYQARWALIDTMHTAVSKSEGERKFKLPPLEVKKFDGNIKNWLSFWGNFKRVDSDPNIDDTEKLQYLTQSMSPGSEVRTFVESFPITNGSYKLCILELKSRYAREDLLIQMYVRELLSLILKREENFDLTILYDSINSHLRSLEVLHVTKDKYSAFLLPMVESALPTEILKIWERAKPADTKDELQCLLTFLKKEVESNQRVELAGAFKINQKQEATAACFTVNPKTSDDPGKTQQKEIRCIWCDKNHSSAECFKIARLTIEQRKEHLKKVKACSLCLKKGHHAKVCKNYVKCYVCQQRHSPILCPGVNPSGDQEQLKPKEKPTIQNHTQDSSSGTTLLQTVTVKLQYGENITTVRALFDSGSQRSYVKKEVVDKIGIPSVNKEELSHSLFGGVSVALQKYDCYDFTVHSIDNKFKFDMSALGQEIICKNVPKVNHNRSLSELLNKNNIKLMDKSEGSDVGLLIGADFTGLLLTNQFIQLENGLTAINTNLGWTLQGKINTQNTVINNNVTTLFCVQNVSDFWNLEVIGIQDPAQVQSKLQKEEEVMRNFENNIKVDEEGRYEVHLPWKPGHDDLLSNRELAIRRLQATTNKLVSSGKFHDYDNIIKEWEQTGVVEQVPDRDMNKDQDVHYLPHRAVTKEASLTTKLRPVYDASAKDKNGKSLNACLDKGINFLDKIPDLLIGFRKRDIGITADIARAFLQISVSPDDRDYLRFIWWKDQALHDFVEYRHCRVVFGLTSSPFLLSATILHHLEQITDARKNTADILARSFYVDNLITSLDSEQTTRDFMQEAKGIMKEAKFDLRQWVMSPMDINETNEKTISVLGLLWNTTTDELSCNIKALPDPVEISNVNKRNLLSLTQKIFDPIGMLCPVTLIPRLLLQEIWIRKITWDSDLPNDILTLFHDWYDNIKCLENCRLPRRLSAERLDDCAASLHMFCDASKAGYAACVFLRTENRGNVTVRLISAKSRISPPEKITIPRLELLAALVGSRLIAAARKHLQLKGCKEFCWTDSGVALCWIKRELTWNTYVGNRVREIRQNTDTNNWEHIPGTENWADLASRGCNARQLLEARWWEGPPWLLRPPEQWPHSELLVDEKEAHKELKRTCHTNVNCGNDMVHNLSYFSKYTKIVRMTAWILRFAHNALLKTNGRKGELTYDEYEEAEKKIIRLIQEENREMIEKHTGKLTRFYDKDNLLRIKTKLLLTDFSENVKTPVVIPAKDDVVRRMVEQRHDQLLHAGTNMLIADLRKRFWIIGVRRLVKSVIDKCAVCKRHRVKPTQATTAPLPLERVQPSAPFEVTGVDLAGPLYLLDGGKCWIVLYTCAVYRAVHLELTQSLSTDAFLRTFRRFIARRGRVKMMISDNGTNFTGTKSLFASIDWNEIQRKSTVLRIQWKFNAPTAAWWGGFFERMIKIIKNLLRRVLGTSSVSYEEMQTLLCDCEAVVNDRPLTYVDGDNTDSLEPLRPSCFLQTLPQSQVTDLDHIDATSLNRRLRYLQRLREDFRHRFKTEYLTELVQKGREKEEGLKVGDIVLVESEEKRVKWPLGRIIEVYKGKDGVDRTAKVKTSTGIKTRPFQRLYKLELSFSEAEGGSEEIEGDYESLLGKKYSIVLCPSSTSTVVKRRVGVEKQNEEKTTRLGRQVKLPSKYKI